MGTTTWDSNAKAGGITLGAPFFAFSGAGAWSTNVSTYSWTQLVSGTNTLVIAAIYNYNGSARTVSTITCGGTTMTKLDSITASLEANTQDMEIWYLAGVAAGSTTIAVTLSASTSFTQGQSICFDGIDQVSPIDSHAISQNTSASTSASLATTVVAANSILGGFIWARSPTTISAGTGTTVLQVTASGDNQASAWSGGIVGTGSQSLAYTFTSSTVPGIATFSLKKSGSYQINDIAISASGTNPGVFANRTITGLTYYEITATALSTTFSIGMVNHIWNDASGTILGGDANGLGFTQDGNVKLNNVILQAIFTYTQADVIQVAIRPADRTIFFKKNNLGNWNNTGGADPATNTSGIDFSTMSFGALLPAFGAAVASPTQIATAAFSSSDWAFTAPTGFASPDSTANVVTDPELVSSTAPFVGAGRKDPVTDVSQHSPHPGSAYGNYSGTKTISGNVKENGANIAGKKVLLLDRNGHFVGLATTDGSGNYTIKGRGRNSTIAIALDDPNYNAIVYDVVVPV